jgi:hypothetical protein
MKVKDWTLVITTRPGEQEEISAVVNAALDDDRVVAILLKAVDEREANAVEALWFQYQDDCAKGGDLVT